MFQISEEMSRELFVSVTYSLGGRWNRLLTNKWSALFYSIICYTLFSKQIGSSCQTSVKLWPCNSVQLSTCLKWCLRVHNDLSTMHALTWASPTIKKASNSCLIAYFTHQAKIQMSFWPHYVSYLSKNFILACHIGLYQSSAESWVKVNVLGHIQTQFLCSTFKIFFRGNIIFSSLSCLVTKLSWYIWQNPPCQLWLLCKFGIDLLFVRQLWVLGEGFTSCPICTHFRKSLSMTTETKSSKIRADY